MNSATEKDPYTWVQQDLNVLADSSHGCTDGDIWKILADNIRDGESLLTLVDYQALKFFLGVNEFSVAARIMRTIKELRNKSPLYSAIEQGLQLGRSSDFFLHSQSSRIKSFAEDADGSTEECQTTSLLITDPSPRPVIAEQSKVEKSPLPGNDHQRANLSQVQSASLVIPTTNFLESPVSPDAPLHSEVVNMGPFVLDDADEASPLRFAVKASAQEIQEQRFETTPTRPSGHEKDSLDIGCKIERYFQTENDDSGPELSFVFRAPRKFDLERTFVQRRLRYAFMQDPVAKVHSKRQSITWPLYRKPGSTKSLELLFQGNKSPQLLWTDHRQPSSELILSHWFDEIDWETKLNNYDQRTENDQELPPFGESGDEGIYSSDVMDEMDLEEEEEARAARSKQVEPLSQERVEAIMAQVVERFTADWEKSSLKRLERQSRSLWKTFRQSGGSDRRARRVQLQLETIQTKERKKKIWQSLVEPTYHSERALKYQAESLRGTIYQQREQQYLSALYDENSKCPPRVATDIKMTQKVVAHSEREGSVGARGSPVSRSSDTETEDSRYAYEDIDAPILEIVSDSGDFLYSDENELDSADTEEKNSESDDSDDSTKLSELVIAEEESEIDMHQEVRQTRTKGSRRSRILSSAEDDGRKPFDPIILTSDSSEGDEPGPVLEALPQTHTNQESRHKREKKLSTASGTSEDVSDRKSRGETSEKESLLSPNMDGTQKVVFKTAEESDEGLDSEVDVAAKKRRTVSDAPGLIIEAQHDQGSAEIRKKRKRQRAYRSDKPSATPRKKKQRQIDSESEIDEEGEDEAGLTKKKRRKTRPVNQQAAARRLQQQRERAQIASRAQEQALIQSDDAAVIINPGDDQVDEEIAIDPELAACLKPHQLEGCRFLWRETIMMSHVSGCLLAHTMGLGKTFQVITYLHTLGRLITTAKNLVPKPLRRPHALILCPASLVKNWIQEFKHWTPKNAIGRVFDPSLDSQNAYRLETLREWKDEGGITILSYTLFTQMVQNKTSVGQMFDDPKDAASVLALLTEIPRVVIADEAHMFKNERTGIGRAVREVHTKVRIALTGSPLANNLKEYWAIMDWIDEGYLGTKRDFQNEYVHVIEDGNKHDATRSEIRQGQKRLKVLLGIIGGKINRRNVDCLRSLLPSKFEYVLFLKFTPLQKLLYNSFIDAMREGDEQKHSKLLSHISRLKWICNFPGLVRPIYTENIEARAAKKRITKAVESEALVDLNDLEIDESRQDTLTEQWRSKVLVEYGTALDAIETSGKMVILLGICRAAKARQEKVLVFSFSIPTINALKAILPKHLKGPVRVITGTSGAKNRVQDVADFNSLEGFAICLISTKAGGQGLNMTGANRVVLFDHEFNPVWAEQAVGRAYRMGQQKDVHAYRLQIDGSFEIRLFQQALRKLGLTSKVVDEKNVQTQLKKQQSLLDYFLAAPEMDRAPEPIGDLEDQLLKDVLQDCPGHVISVEKTESFHVEEVDELDATDHIEIKAQTEAYWKEQERKRVQAEYIAASAAGPAQNQSQQFPNQYKPMASQQPSQQPVFPSTFMPACQVCKAFKASQNGRGDFLRIGLLLSCNSCFLKHHRPLQSTVPASSTTPASKVPQQPISEMSTPRSAAQTRREFESRIQALFREPRPYSSSQSVPAQSDQPDKPTDSRENGEQRADMPSAPHPEARRRETFPAPKTSHKSPHTGDAAQRTQSKPSTPSSFTRSYVECSRCDTPVLLINGKTGLKDTQNNPLCNDCFSTL